MIETYIIQGGRASGKTYTMMTEIHELIVGGERPRILVVHPDMRSVQYWHGEWVRRFPHLPRPDYTTIGNMLKIRGMEYQNVYVDRAYELDAGIYDLRLNTVFVGMRGRGQVVFEVRPTELSLKSHNDYVEPPPDPAEATRRRLRRWKRTKPVLDGE